MVERNPVPDFFNVLCIKEYNALLSHAAAYARCCESSVTPELVLRVWEFADAGKQMDGEAIDAALREMRALPMNEHLLKEAFRILFAVHSLFGRAGDLPYNLLAKLRKYGSSVSADGNQGKRASMGREQRRAGKCDKKNQLDSSKPPAETSAFLDRVEDMVAEFAEHGICPPEEKNRDG